MHDSVDGKISELAARQHGVVARRQLLEGGISESAVEHRIRSGRLMRAGRGVYRAGPLTGPLVAEWIAVLSAARGAALADWSAGAVWGLATSASSASQAFHPSPQPQPSPVVLVVPGGASGRNRLPGVRRRRDILAGEVTHRDGLPLTTVARTLLDLARCEPRAAFEDAVATALRKRLLSHAALREMMSRHPRHRGARVIAALLDDAATTASRSEAERRIRRLCHSGGLPVPEVNVLVHGFEVDLYFRKQRVVLEIDGFSFHNSDRAFHNDRLRDSVLAAAGILVVRVTWRHLTRERDATLVRIAQALVLRDRAVRSCACADEGCAGD
jgi:very-short-patch-repair endonuclease/predicted transcriptional regulator of viral defense system